MSKRFRAFPDDPERLLMKIGYSDFNTGDGEDKLLKRLGDHKTALISFKVHRIYLFTDDGGSTLKGKAFDAEQNLHRMVVDTYNPPSVNITFDNKGSNRDKPRPTEWFWVKDERKFEKMLRWMDEQVFAIFPYPAIHGTRFLGDGPKDYQFIDADKEYPNRGQHATRFEVNPTRGTVKEREELSRSAKSFHGKNVPQKVSQLDRIEKEKQQKARKKAISEESKRLAKTSAFWNQPYAKGGLKGMKFYDKDMGKDEYGRKDDGKYPNKIVVKVSRWKPNAFLVHYTIDARRRDLVNISKDELDYHSGTIPLHEFLDITSVAKYKKKHIESYKYFEDRFNYDPEVVLDDD
jgi:hypothetical protein